VLLPETVLQSTETSASARVEAGQDADHPECFPVLFTDYLALTAPHVPAVQAVLSGTQSRYKLGFENAVLLFDHGCLMGRVFFEGRFYALPPMALDALGAPYLRALPIAQRPTLVEFCTLPKGILLFYFTLLKQVFRGHRLYGKRLNLKTGQFNMLPIPTTLHPWLQAVGWPYASVVETEPGCSA
jgi:hypothetical protein